MFLLRFLIPIVIATPAAAWEFTPTPICTLTHTTGTAQFTVTYDAGLPEYTLNITLTDGNWPTGTPFGMRFDGPNPIAIGTDRHTVEGPSLTVRDSGFGNVLNGLQFNDIAIATADGFAVTLDLADAAEPVAAFRLCPAPVTS